MKEKAWAIKDCPVCNGTGKRDGRICFFCSGEKRLYLRWESTQELRQIISNEEFVDCILDAIKGKANETGGLPI